MQLRSGRRCTRAHSTAISACNSVERYQEKQSAAAKLRASTSLRALSRTQIIQTAEETSGQCGNAQWARLRSRSLTASKFGEAYRALISGKDERIENFLKNWLNRPNLQGIPAIEWGLVHEKEAIRAYERYRGVKVQPTGLWLSRDGALGASPDGLVHGGVGIIEVKCPYSCRSADSWEDALETGLFPPYLELLDAKGENVRLKTTNDYYFQVQGQLYMTGAKWCDFVVWTPGYVKIDRIQPDRAWAKSVLPILGAFSRNCLSVCSRDPTTGGIKGVSRDVRGI